MGFSFVLFILQLYFTVNKSKKPGGKLQPEEDILHKWILYTTKNLFFNNFLVKK